jgi:Dolichyl-phosphate-mannose-protein mannosyltransferase
VQPEPVAGRSPLRSGVRFRALARARALLSGVHWADVASLLVLGALPVVMLLTLDDYGLTYDEEPHLRLGERVLAFYASLFHPQAALSRSAYGAGFDLAAALLRRVSPWDEYRTNHILCIAVAQLGLLGTWKLGRLLAGPAAGLAGLAFLVIEPVYYGHQFNNPKDIPFAVGYIWGLYAIARLLAAPSLGRLWRYWVGLGIALGLGMSVRVGGAILMAYLGLFLGLLALDRARLAGWPAARALGSLFWKAALSGIGGWLLMLAFWPRALTQPVKGPAAVLETVTNYTAYDSPTLLGGKLVPSQSVPWSYLPTYFALQQPELISLYFVAACAALCACSVLALRRKQPIAWVPWLLVVAVLLPPSYAIARGSTLYNGLRHFLFVMPPICVLAGAALALSLRFLWGRRRALGLAALLATLALGAEPLLALVRLHPHQHVYFNLISGGLVPAVKNYETEYYGSVYRELGEKLVREVWKQRRQEYLNTTFQVAGCGSKLFFTRNLPLDFQYQTVRNAPSADYYATYVRDRCLQRYRDRPLVTEVTREGAQLAAARQMPKKRPRPAPPSPASAP